MFKNERVFLVEVDQQVHYSWCFILHGNFPRVQTMINEQVPWDYHFMHIINVHVWVLGVSLTPSTFLLMSSPLLVIPLSLSLSSSFLPVV